jgi:hypothetical protein
VKQAIKGLMAFFPLLLIAIAAYCLLTIAPVALLLRAGYCRLALAVAVMITLALWYDHSHNWDGISYPLWLLRGFDDFFGITIAASLIMVLIAVRANWVERRQSAASKSLRR